VRDSTEEPEDESDWERSAAGHSIREGKSEEERGERVEPSWCDEVDEMG